MASKREQVLWETVWPEATSLERAFGLIGALSAGIYLLYQTPAELQRDLIAALNPVSAIDNDVEWRAKIAQILAESVTFGPSIPGARQAKRPKSG